MVAPGWVNVDSSLNAFFSGWPSPLLKTLYAFTDAQRFFTVEEYIRLLKENRFIFHSLQHGVPFTDESIDFVYSSHLLEHFFREEAKLFLTDIYRSMKKGGRIRLAVPDLEIALRHYYQGEKELALSFFFTASHAGVFDAHRYMYDFDLLRELLESVGFRNVVRYSFQEGLVPDLETLDNRPEETLYTEATK